MNPEWVEDIEDREFKEWISATLRDIHEAALKGLDDEEAIRRAGDLEESILAGRIAPGEIALDEGWKDVLHALVHRVLPRSEGNERARRAAIIGRFLEDIRWEDDLLDEKGELIGDCKAAGQTSRRAESEDVSSVDVSVGSSLAEPSEPHIVSGPTTDPAEEEAGRFFEKKRAFLDMVFVELHGFTPKEAQALKDELLVWFLRFCRREENWARQPRSLLFAAACQLARQHRIFKEEVSEAPVDQNGRIETIGLALSLMDNLDETRSSRERDPNAAGE